MSKSKFSISFGDKDKNISLTGIRLILFYLITFGNIINLFIPIYSAFFANFVHLNDFFYDILYFDTTYFDSSLLDLVLGKYKILYFILGSILFFGPSYYWVSKIFFARNRKLKILKINAKNYILMLIISDILIYSTKDISFITNLIIFFIEIFIYIYTLNPILNYGKIETTKNSKNKIIAVILNILSTGLGYLYVGNIKKALLFSIAFPLLILTLFFLSTMYVNKYTVILSFSFIILAYIYAIYDVIKIIDQNRSKYIKYNKWYFMILFYIMSVSYYYILKIYAPIKYFNLPSSSMSSTLVKGDHFCCVKDKSFIPSCGDIVVFKYPKNPKMHFVKRCVAVEGDTVMLHNKVLYILPHEGNKFVKKNYKKDQYVQINKKLWLINPYRVKYPGIQNDPEVKANGMYPEELFEFPPTLVKKDHFFMMGDNRDHSNDSRFWGTVAQKFIVGKLNSVYINFNNLNRLGMKVE